MKTPKMKYRIAALLLALMLLVLGGCGAAPEQTMTPTAETESQEEAKVPGSVTVTGEAAAGLTEGQQTVIVAFMERYYQSMGRLEVLDCGDLFSEEEQVAMHRDVWTLLCEIRRASLSDLTLLDYAVTLSWHGRWNRRRTVPCGCAPKRTP